MTAAPYILAGSFTDAHEFALHELGLPKGHYRVVTSPSTISGRRNTKIYLVPGWERRMDRFAMRGALKYTRLEKIDVAEMRQDAAEPDDLQPPGVQLTLVDPDEAAAFLMVAEGGPDANPEEVLDTKPPTVEEPKRRRRSRCKDCGTLHFKEDSCPSEPFPET